MSARDTFHKELILDKVVSFMEEHDKVARRQITELGCLGDEVFNSLWEDLAKELNTISEAFGILPKSTAKWIEFWNNTRLEARQRASEFLKHQARSTGNIPNPILLTNHEIRINAIFGKAGLGLSIIPEFGIESSKNRVNPIDLFDEFFPKSKMANRDSTSVSELQKAEIVKTMAQPNNIKFALGLESDPQKRINILTSLTTRLNSIKPGTVKDCTQWLSTWDNMWRHCYASISAAIDPNRFLARVHCYRNQGNKSKPQETLAADKTDNATSLQAPAKKRIAARQPSSRANKKKSVNINEELIACGFIPNPSADVSTDSQNFQATHRTLSNETSATPNQTKSVFNPRAATFGNEMFSTCQENSFENLTANFSTPSKAPVSPSSLWISEPNSSIAGTSIPTSTNVSKKPYKNNSEATSTSQVLIDSTSTAGMSNAPTMQSFLYENESSRLNEPIKLVDITVDEFRKMMIADFKSVFDEKFSIVNSEDVDKCNTVSNESILIDDQTEEVPQKLPNALLSKAVEVNFVNQKQETITFEASDSNNETSTSSPALYLSDGDYLTEQEFCSVLKKMGNDQNNRNE